jgi:hypothetical protein
MSSFPITNSALRWLEVILAERFGQAWRLSRVDEGLRLQLAGAEGAILFDTLCEGFTQAHSDQPGARWDAEREGWSSVLGGPLPTPGVPHLPSPLIKQRDDEHVIHYDILGLTYWMLARVEEIGRTDLDNHERFPAVSSHAYKHDYLGRPAVDEWLHLLGQVIQRQWPALELKRHEFSIKVSHDVDQPSLYAFKPWRTIARMMAGHIIKRRDLKAFFTAPYVKIATRNELINADPYNTFDWLMDVSEENNLQSAFYFICGRTNPIRDAEYELEHPAIRQLMRRIHERGHEIGLHPSYGTFQSTDLLKREADRLKRVCAEEGIHQTQWGGRMHYLRWEHPTTLRNWEDAGMTYDSTLGYADHPGFRSGTCHEYPAFDPVAERRVNLVIRPLITMECTVLDDAYLGLGASESAMEVMNSLRARCQRVGGLFTLLWHNSNLTNIANKSMYSQLAGSKRL